VRSTEALAVSDKHGNRLHRSRDVVSPQKSSEKQDSTEAEASEAGAPETAEESSGPGPSKTTCLIILPYSAFTSI